MNAADADREIVSTRVFDFPREAVYAAWIDPAALARWWGPKDFTNTVEAFEPKPGGAWKFAMRAPDGTAYPQHSVFVEIVPRARIVFDHLPPHAYRAVVSFEDSDGKTKLTFRMIHETAEECERVKKVVVEGNEQNFDRLEAVLTEEAKRK